MNPKVDLYLEDGCGRCSFYKTAKCKVNTWREEVKQLRKVVLECGLEEEFKWSQPCYTFQNNNILIVTAFKDYAALALFKGVLLMDQDNILIAPGKNSQASRQIRFTSVQDILEMEDTLKAYIYEAIEVEKAGLKVDFKEKTELVLPEELEVKLDKNEDLKVAFKSLTPGRQRAYLLYFSAAKQSKTRETRIEKYIPRILSGKGINDCTCGMSKRMPSCDGTHKYIK